MNTASVLVDRIDADVAAVANSLDALIARLSTSLHEVSLVTAESSALLENVVVSTCDAVDSNVKDMYQLIVKTEELNRAMLALQPLSSQVRELKRLMDLLERAT